MKTIDTTLAQQLTDDCQAFVNRVRDLSETEFTEHITDKWSVAEVMQHLYLSARPVARLMAGPREVFSQWGQAEAPSRTYDQIAAMYTKGLATGVKAPATASPRPEDMEVSKQEVMDRFMGVYQALTGALAGWSDRDLDTYRIPHPALGKLTVREMLYFTSIHTQHHLRSLKNL